VLKVRRWSLFRFFIVALLCGLNIGCGKVWTSINYPAAVVSLLSQPLDSSWAPQWAAIGGVWHLDGTIGAIPNGGPISDSSGKGANGNMNAVGASFVPGKFSQGVLFGGAANIDIPAGVVPDPCSTLTLMFWINGTTTGAFFNALGKTGWAAGNPGYVIQEQGAGSSFQLRLDTSAGANQSTLWNAGDNFFDGSWHMLAFTLNSGAVTLYKDGQVDNTGTYAPGTGFCNAPIDLTTGLGSNIFDEMAIWTAALASTDIATIYARQYPTYAVRNQMRFIAASSTFKEFQFSSFSFFQRQVFLPIDL
jgi:hypothetical protein